ncbi:DUF6354 family protein [Streptomyces rubradiris]|uniref:DUF6354 family protein n=1 Tax=Streptomyces rubradiris TaxID=285531 RepID=UPI0036ECCA55
MDTDAVASDPRYFRLLTAMAAVHGPAATPRGYARAAYTALGLRAAPREPPREHREPPGGEEEPAGAGQQALFPVTARTVRTGITYARPVGGLLTADDLARLSSRARKDAR